MILVREYDFDEDAVSTLTYESASAVEIDRRRSHLQLRRGTASFPAASSVVVPYVRGSNITNLRGFDVEGDAPPGTFLDYRLGNGAADYFWNGTAWAVASAAEHWSPLADVQSNLPLFPVDAAAPGFRVSVRLRSADGTATPVIRSVLVAYEVNVDLYETAFVDALIPYFRNVLALADWQTKGDGTASYVLSEADLKAFDVVDAPRAFDRTADPRFRDNLATGYDPAARTLTLRAPVPAGNDLRVQFLYRPRGYFRPGQDLPEEFLAGKVPALVLEDYRAVQGGMVPGPGTVVRDETAGTALRLPPPRIFHVAADLLLLASSTRELYRLQAATLAQFDSHPLLTCPATGVQWAIRITREPSTVTQVGLGEVRAARVEFQLDHVQVYTRPAESVNLVRTFRGALNRTQGS